MIVFDSWEYVAFKKGARNNVWAICFSETFVVYGDDTAAVVMDVSTGMEVDRIEMRSFINHVTLLDGGEILLAA